VLLCGHAPDIDRHASDVRNVPKPDISLRQVEKNFHSENKSRQIEKKFIWVNKRDNGMSALPRKRTCYHRRNCFGSASRGSIRYAETHCVLYATALEKPSQSGFEQHFVQIHAFKVDVNCWVRNVTIDLAGSADE
jgi:hypothetical protein